MLHYPPYQLISERILVSFILVSSILEFYKFFSREPWSTPSIIQKGQA